ncbi:MAG: cupin domain-containing protein [Actinomycetota bacterium]|nr:cupin domain-containing protein [Actinomycetota bacterium]
MTGVTLPYRLLPAGVPSAHRISAGDTVRLAVLAGPGDGIDHSVVFEVWDPRGAQPLNSHPAATETFLFLRGSGQAESDGAVTAVRAGQLLVLPAGSRHRIVNTGPGRLYAITTMLPDQGFADLIRRGPPAPLDKADLDVLAGVR